MNVLSGNKVVIGSRATRPRWSRLPQMNRRNLRGMVDLPAPPPGEGAYESETARSEEGG